MNRDDTPLIEMKGVSRHYRSGDTVVKALDEVDLSIWPGEFVAIIGQSGSGKSTMMNIIGCLDKPTGGVYKIHGKEISGLKFDDLASLRRKTFGFIFQRYNLLSTANAAENVEIPALYAGLSKNERTKRAMALLRSLDMEDRADHRPAALSGGQQQRVAIARALMNDPPVVLADEPTGALDSKSGEDVLALLKKLNDEGRTVILITHDRHIASHARRTVRVQDGKIIEDTGIDKERKTDTDFAKKKQNNAIEDHNNSSVTASSVEAVKTAMRSLRVNFFRTALTLLGIVIGVAAVVTMLAVGNGSKQAVLSQISAMGTNLLNIRPGAPGIRSSGDIATLVPEDAKVVADLDNIVAVVPERRGGKTLRYGTVDYATQIRGVSHDFPLVFDWEVAQGTFFTKEDLDRYAAVTVLGTTVSDTFFKDEDPVGKFIMLGNVPFEVIGVMKSKGAAPWGSDQDDVAYVPYTTSLVRLFGSTYLNSITAKVDHVDDIAQTEDEIIDLLIKRHGTEDFSVRNSASFLEMATSTQNTLTVLLGAVSAISLLVGGIGVMNIMLVSVAERTREIGIRMATGARMRDIMIQFNTEAAVVCTIGGVIGIMLGVFAGLVLSLFEVNIAFSAAPAILAFTSAVVTGILFGYLPARKAARLDPVIALSSE